MNLHRYILLPGNNHLGFYMFVTDSYTFPLGTYHSCRCSPLRPFSTTNLYAQLDSAAADDKSGTDSLPAALPIHAELQPICWRIRVTSCPALRGTAQHFYPLSPVPHIINILITFWFTQTFSKIWLLSSGCEESREGYHHGAVFHPNQIVHTRVKCRLTCHCLLPTLRTTQKNCDTPQSHKLCRLRQSMMETTTKKRDISYNKNLEGDSQRVFCLFYQLFFNFTLGRIRCEATQ